MLVNYTFALQAHPLSGRVGKHNVYGIKSIAAVSGGPVLGTEACAAAARSPDARDKFFLQSVPEWGSSEDTERENDTAALQVI